MRPRTFRALRPIGVVAISIITAAALVACHPDTGGSDAGTSDQGRQSAAAASNPVAAEEALPGDLEWQLEQPSDDKNRQIEGYASATSVNIGERITFYVTVNPLQSYGIEIYRMGYYQGLGGRFIQQVGQLPGATQPDCPMDARTGLTECHWTPSYELAVPPSWTSGIYLAKLINSNGYSSYIVFTVRDDARHADLLYQQSVTTYQAYNSWPQDAPGGVGRPLTGKSLYPEFSSLTPTGLGPNRAVMVSFDRPYSGDHGAGNFLDWEFYYVRWLEKSGYDVSYSTDVDTHRNGRILLNYKGFLSVGHDEYWTREMYDNVTAARDAGVNIGFFGANAIYWQMRFAPSSSGIPDRVEVCAKEADLDQVKGPTTTVAWRDPLISRPEQGLIGIQFTSAQPAGSAPVPLVPINVGNSVYQGAGARDSTPMSAVVGYETDHQFAGVPLPDAKPGTYVLLSNSPYQNADGKPDYQNSVIYQANSGAWVFGAGSIEWSWGLYDDDRHHNTDPVVQRVTANVLDRFLHRGDNPGPTR